MAPETRSKKRRRSLTYGSENGKSGNKNRSQPSQISGLPGSKTHASPSAIERMNLENDGNQNEPLDHLMSLIGLECVKEHFLRVYAKVRAAQELDVEFPQRELDLNIAGNRGIGRLPSHPIL